MKLVTIQMEEGEGIFGDQTLFEKYKWAKRVKYRRQ